MAENETRLKITAVDAASEVLRGIKGRTDDLEGSFRKLAAVSFAGLSAGGLAASISSAISAAAAMEELSQKTGIATAQLTALDYAMRREGVSTEAFAKGMKELSKNMVEAGEASSKAGKLFAELGVNAKGDTREALLKIADTFAALPDGATKAALAVELFGKAGLDLIPALNNGAEGIRQIEEQARKLGLTFDGETGRAAKKFKDDMFALEESSKRLGVSLATQLLPNLTSISAAMRQAAEDGGLLQAVWVGLGGLGNLIFNGTEVNQAKNEIATLTKQIEELEAATVGAEGKQLANLIKALDTLNPKLEAAKQRLKELTEAPPAADKPKDDPRVKALQDRINELLRPATAKAAAAIGEDLDKILQKTLAVSQGVEADFTKAVAALNIAVATGQISLEAYGAALDKLLSRQPAFKAARDAEISAAKVRNEEVQKEIEADQRLEDAKNNSIRSIREYAEQLEFEATLQGLSNAEREKAIALRQLEKAGIDTTTESVQVLVNRIRDQIQAQQDLRNQVSVWNELSDGAGRFFYDLALNGRDAFSSLKSSLKSFAAEMVALFAKRFVLQIGASITGSTALSAAASSTGEGSLAGSLLNAGASFFGGSGAGAGLLQSGLGSLLGGGTGGAVAASELLSMASAAGPYIAAIAAAYALYNAFKDKGENWKGRIGFGDMANAYSVDGVFGREGFQYLAGDDTTNRAIQGFFASTRPIDQQLSGFLTPAQRAAISGRLSAYNTSGTRADGQPAEFAFGKGDETAGQQLTLEYLKQKYGAIFDEIDGEFAAFIRGYTGKSEDLLKAIGEFAGVLGALDGIGIPGLDIKALQGLKKAGEDITQTFTRVAAEWSAYQNAFLTDAEKLGIAQQQIAKGFDDLGIAVPKSKEEFKALVASLDLSTEAGRTLFAALMKLAPGFAAVEDAAAGLLASFDNIVGQTRPGYTQGVLTQQRDDALGQFIARNPWTQGLSREFVLGQLRMITRDDFRNYRPEDQALINTILGITNELDGLGGAAADASRALGSVGRSIAQEIDSWAAVKMSLWDYLRGLFTDPELSPLDPSQQLDTLKTQFTTAISRANGGDFAAGQSIQGLVQQILQRGREQFGSSSGYVDLFNWVTGLAGDFVQPGGGMDLQRQMAADSRRQVELLETSNAIMQAVLERIGVQTAVTAESGQTVATAVTNIGAATARR